MFTLGPSGDGSRGSRPSSRGPLGKPIATPRLDEREIAADLVPWLMERPMEGGGPLVPRPGSGYSHVRRATARSADAGWRP